MYKKLFFPLIAVALSLSTQAQTTAVSFHSTNDNYWQMKTETVTDNVGTANIIIRTSQPHQTFKGWGTCFNELDYDAWSLLSTADRELFVKRAFNPNGSSHSLQFSNTNASQEEEARAKGSMYSVWDDDWSE